MTSNHAQGQTLRQGGLYLERSVRSRGHLYVTFGRCGDPKRLVYATQVDFDNIKDHLEKGNVYSWIRPPVHAQEKLICQGTQRATTNPSLHSKTLGEENSDLPGLFLFDLFSPLFKITLQIMPKQK